MCVRDILRKSRYPATPLSKRILCLCNISQLPLPPHTSLFLSTYSPDFYIDFYQKLLNLEIQSARKVNCQSGCIWMRNMDELESVRIKEKAKESKRLRHPLRTHRTLFLQQQLWTTKWSRKLIRTIKPDWGKCLKSCNLFVGLHIKCLNYGKGPGKNW